MEEENKSGVEHTNVMDTTVTSIIRLVALLGGGYLFIQDVYLHNIAPISIEIYGILAGIASGNEKILSLLGIGHKIK